VAGLEVSNEMLSLAVARHATRLGADFALPDADFPQQRAGVCSRRFLESTLGTRDLALCAARKAIDRAGIALSEYASVIVTSVTYEAVVPPLATWLHGQLGLSSRVACFDTNVGCNGFLAGLRLAQAFVNQGSSLLVSADAMSRVLDATDRATCVLFGDAATACVLQQGEGVGEVSWFSQGSKGEHIRIEPADHPIWRFCAKNGELSLVEDTRSRHRVLMNGRQVFRDMVGDLPVTIAQELAARGRQISDFDHFLFHQANRRIIDAVAERLEIPPEKLRTNLETLGNTTSASIPLVLAQGCPGRSLLVGFGTGYSVGLAEIEQ
jgi:3-oxoacyl-[acyl-carrier-protein] synthase-3